VQVLQAGGSLKQETMGWLEAEGVTVSQRSKEYADDYRYFPEPDLPPLVLSREWVEEIRARLPELPDARRARFIETYGVPPPDAGTLVSSRTLADFFEESVTTAGAHHGHALSNWILGDVSHLLNTANVDISDSHLRPEGLAQLLDLVQKGMLSGPSSKSVLEEMFKSGKAPAEIIKEQNLGQISGSDELLSAVRQAIADNPGAVADFKAGKEQSIMFLTGQVMRLTRGRANPGLTRDLLQRELA
jgi:aspartyl-tRNA(Asn)/glutamyl-tRNA(Gln) amidotransferase subunit B